MELDDVKRFDSGVVLLTYLPASYRGPAAQALLADADDRARRDHARP